MNVDDETGPDQAGLLENMENQLRNEMIQSHPHTPTQNLNIAAMNNLQVSQTVGGAQSTFG